MSNNNDAEGWFMLFILVAVSVFTGFLVGLTLNREQTINVRFSEYSPVRVEVVK